VAHKLPAAPAEKPLTLSDADISSQRAVTRRSLFAVLGITAGVAAAAAFGTADDAPAADGKSDADSGSTKKKRTTKKPPKEESDSD
jgi:hypothetical protein